MRTPTLIVALTVALSSPATAQLRLASIFGEHMVLQRDQPTRIWGWATPGETVTLRFAGQTATATANDDTTWVGSLPPFGASAVGREVVVSSPSGTVRLADVLVGDVWLCGGQSNMEWTVRGSRDSDVEIDSANTPSIRFVRLPKIARAEPQRDFPAKSPTHGGINWRLCMPNQVEDCTAVGYYFARRIHRRLQVPIGLIDTSWGGTMAQHWCSKATLRTIPAVEPYFARYEAKLQEWVDGGGEEGAAQRFAEDTAAWEKARATAKAAGEREPRRPRQDAYRDPSHQGHPGAMFDGVIAPLARLSLRGVLFYQGENNSFTEGWKPFPRTYPAVIRDWRQLFGDDDLPFGLIQIAGWSTRRSMTYDMNHHTNIVREVQLDTWRDTQHTGLVVTYDTNSNGGIHPQRKLPVGERTARWALAEVYDVLGRRSRRPLEWRGPVYAKMRIDGIKVIASFVEDTARGLRLDQDVDVGFYVAGEDRVFHFARARVLQKTSEVEIWSDAVPRPVAARYGWSNLPAGGLMNGRELPAYPFRTDGWPLEPHQSTGAYVRVSGPR